MFIHLANAVSFVNTILQSSKTSDKEQYYYQDSRTRHTIATTVQQKTTYNHNESGFRKGYTSLE